MWGGQSAPPPDVNVSAFNDLYILTLPSFIWLKVFPDHHGNATYKYGHYAASCNMVLGNSQMFVIGGTYPNPGDEDICDLSQSIWAQHNLFTGTLGNVGNDPNDTYWGSPNTSITSNVVPIDVYRVVGGDKNGGATLRAPKSGYDTPNGGLQTLLARTPTFAARSATRPVTTVPATGSSSLSTGAIVGIAIGSAAGLALAIISGWCVISRHIRRQREEHRPEESLMSESYYGPSTVSPESMQTPFVPPAVGSLRQLEDTSPGVTPAAELDPGPLPAELDVQRATPAGNSDVGDDRTVLPTYRMTLTRLRSAFGSVVGREGVERGERGHRGSGDGGE